MGVIVARACLEGVHCIGDSSFLVIPLTVRRWCRLPAGHRVLLAGEAATGTLLIYTLSAVHAALATTLRAVQARRGQCRPRG